MVRDLLQGSDGSLISTYAREQSSSSFVTSLFSLRWTKDLHEKIVECVNRVGGADSK